MRKPGVEENGQEAKGGVKALEEPKRRVSLAQVPTEPLKIVFEEPEAIKIGIIFTKPLFCNARHGLVIGGPEQPEELSDQNKLQGKGRKKRPPVDFNALVRRHFYLLPGAKLPEGKFVADQRFPHWPNTLGFPAKAFKDCFLSAAAKKLGLTPWSIQEFIQVFGVGEDPSLAVLKYDYGRIRQDTLPIINQGRRTGAYTNWRPELHGVTTDLVIEWDPKVYSKETILNGLALGGRWGGVGDGRAEKSGYPVGLFRLAEVKDQKGNRK